MSDVADSVGTAERFFEGHPASLAIFRTVRTAVDAIGPASVRTSRSQVAFARRRGFAWLWMPGMWLRHPSAETVLSIALARHDRSPRFKQIVHPSRRVWMHHLELNDAADIAPRSWGGFVKPMRRLSERRQTHPRRAGGRLKFRSMALAARGSNAEPDHGSDESRRRRRNERVQGSA